VHKIYPLEKLWIESGTSKGTLHELEIHLIMPEASLTLLASNTAEKVRLLHYNTTANSLNSRVSLSVLSDVSHQLHVYMEFNHMTRV